MICVNNEEKNLSFSDLKKKMIKVFFYGTCLTILKDFQSMYVDNET